MASCSATSSSLKLPSKQPKPACSSRCSATQPCLVGTLACLRPCHRSRLSTVLAHSRPQTPSPIKSASPQSSCTLMIYHGHLSSRLLSRSLRASYLWRKAATYEGRRRQQMSSNDEIKLRREATLVNRGHNLSSHGYQRRPGSEVPE
jgi:hypothetical protein